MAIRNDRGFLVRKILRADFAAVHDCALPGWRIDASE